MQAAQGERKPGTAVPREEAPLPPVEMGWLLGPARSARHEACVEEARRAMLARLRQQFPRFDWRMPVLRLADVPGERCVDPVLFLERAEEIREERGWDFALLVTETDLKGYFRGFALAAPSRVLSAAVLSTARLGGERGEAAGDGVLARRVEALAMHMLGHLGELPHSEDPRSFMFAPETVRDLDRMERLAPGEAEALAAALETVADLRLEESRTRPRGAPAFYLRAALENRRGLLQSVRRVRPWLLPLRLGGLTTAAMSALLVLLTTAEAWEIGAGQPAAGLALVSLLAIAFTSAAVLHRQRLLLPHRGRGLTELRALSNLATVLIVVAGMLTAYAMLFAVGLLLGALLFDAPLIDRWTGEAAGPARARIAAFASALSITIGALGATFEARTYLRHVTRVDEET